MPERIPGGDGGTKRQDTTAAAVSGDGGGAGRLADGRFGVVSLDLHRNFLPIWRALLNALSVGNLPHHHLIAQHAKIAGRYSVCTFLAGMDENPEGRFRAALSKLGCTVREVRDGRSWMVVTSYKSTALLSMGMDRENAWRQLLMMVIRKRTERV